MNLQTRAEEVIRLLPEHHVQLIGLYEKTQKKGIAMAYKVIILYRLYMPPYFLGTFTEYPFLYAYIIYNEVAFYPFVCFPIWTKGHCDG